MRRPEPRRISRKTFGANLILRMAYRYYMSMYRTLHRRSLRLVTMLVVTAMLLAPTVSLANCCCVLAKVGQAAGLSTDGCCDRDSVPSCCASRGGQADGIQASSAQRSCCSNRAPAQPTDRSPDASSKAEAEAVPSPSQCDCERSCCDGVSNLNVAISNESDSPRLGHDVDSEPAFLFVSYGLVPTSFESGIDHSPRFLSAPHHCATLCRWLN
jgi:hypothetical protein